MRGAIANSLLFIVAQTFTQDSADMLNIRFADKLLDRVSDQAVQAWPVDRTDLESTTLAKMPGHLPLRPDMGVPQTEVSEQLDPVSNWLCQAAPVRLLMALEEPKKVVGGAFGLFLKEKRSTFAEMCKGKAATAVVKMAGDEWKKLPDAEKATYESKLEEAKAQYEKDLAAFLAAGGSRAAPKKRNAEGKVKGEKQGKDPNAPKMAVGGAYGVYLGENRESIIKSLPEGHKITDVAKKAGEMWKALSEAEKKPYEDKFAKKKEEYNAAMAEYKKNGPSPSQNATTLSKPPSKKKKVVEKKEAEEEEEEAEEKEGVEEAEKEGDTDDG